MIATYVNCLAVIAGSLLGLLLKSRVTEKFREAVSISAGLATLAIGMKMAMSSSNVLVLLLSLALGGCLGYLLKIEDAIASLGAKIEKKIIKKGSSEGSFAQGFMSASILFCSGAMTIVGSIQAGASGDYKILFLKSAMDGFMAIALASTYGVGVSFSALFVLVYQGFFTLAGSSLQSLMGEAGINEMGAAGGALLLLIGLDLLGVKKFKTANFLLSLVFAPFLLWLWGLVF